MDVIRAIRLADCPRATIFLPERIREEKCDVQSPARKRDPAAAVIPVERAARRSAAEHTVMVEDARRVAAPPFAPADHTARRAYAQRHRRQLFRGRGGSQQALLARIVLCISEGWSCGAPSLVIPAQAGTQAASSRWPCWGGRPPNG